MANTLTLVSAVNQNEQFRGAFTNMWKVRATIDDTDSVSATDSLEMTVTVPGVALGDMVIGCSLTADYNDGTDSAVVQALVSAANTVTLKITADVGAFAADALNAAVVRILIGRPSW
jgi:hypothetical protein